MPHSCLARAGLALVTVLGLGSFAGVAHADGRRCGGHVDCWRPRGGPGYIVPPYYYYRRARYDAPRWGTWRARPAIVVVPPPPVIPPRPVAFDRPTQAGIGMTMFVGGIVTGVVGVSLAAGFDSSPAAVATGVTLGTVGGLALIGGVGCMATAGPHSPNGEHASWDAGRRRIAELTVAPTVVPGGAGLVVGGRF